MKLLHRYIFKELTIPFFSSLFILIFVLLSNFILKNIDKFLGKGIPIGVVFKFIFLNSAWIFSLAVPMAILITTLMAFGRLSSDNEITAFKASGIKYIDLLKPGILFGTLLILFMIPFNLWILPEMNHNIKKTSYDISRSRPDVEFNEQLLNTLADKIIYVGKRLNKNSFNDIIIFDNKYKNNHTTILSNNGSFHSLQDGIILDLNNGSIHEHLLTKNEYRKTYFDNYKIAVPFDELNINSNINLERQEREMNLDLLIEKINFYKNKIIDINKKYEKNNITLESMKSTIASIDSSKIDNLLSIKRIENRINKLKLEQQKNLRLVPHHQIQINKYSVEIHKKFSIPIACLFFIFLGTPLGIMAKRGNMSISIAVSLLFFIIYWSFLIVGENLADKNKLNPAIAMWLPNIFIGFLSYYLYNIYTRENQTLNLNFSILKFKKMK